MSETKKEPPLEGSHREIPAASPIKLGEDRAKVTAIIEGKYSEADVMRWQRGAQEFGSFYNSLTFTAKERLIGWNNLGAPIFPATLQAVFLREKPSCEIWSNPELEEKLQLYGLRVRHGICFRPHAVLELRKKHDDVFQGFPTDDADAIVNAIVSDKDSRKFGLLCGFPITAVNAYMDSQKPKQEVGIAPKRKSYNIHGVYWTDEPMGSGESDAWAERLTLSFERSGMLNVDLGIDQFESPFRKTPN